MLTERHKHEIEHGKMLANCGAESIWGWRSPAGLVRAKRRSALILSNIPMATDLTFLEIGCGTGDFTALFADSCPNLVALDISKDLTDIARKNLATRKNVEVITSSLENLPYETRYDAVIGSSVLHHLEIKPALIQIYHLMKPGGYFSFAEPNMLNPQILVQKNIPWIKKRMGDSPDETAFFHWQMQGMLEQAGFMDIFITPFDWLHPLVPDWLIQPVCAIGKTLERIPLVREFAGSLLIFARKGKD